MDWQGQKLTGGHVQMFRKKSYKVGQTVVYRMPKSSTSPGERAINVKPSSRGELYAYEVEKYWIVSKLLDEGRIELRTRTGKQHVISMDDSRLRNASFIERLILSDRFPKLAAEKGAADSAELTGFSG